MTDPQIPVDLLQWGLALLPIAVLMVLMVALRWTAPQAGAFGMFAAAGISLLAFRTPLETLAVGGAKGVWDALFILYVVWPALLLYQVTDQAGGYEALRRGITRFSNNELFVVLALGWVFSSFLQGIAGFGTPIAVVAPLLVAFGVRPIYAVAIPIIAHVWAKFFGTLAVGWLATLQVVDLADEAEVAFQTGLLLIIPVVLGGFTVVWMYGRGPALRHAWPLVLIIAAIHGGGQAVMTLVDPVLSTFIPATLALLALYPLSRWKRYADLPDTITDRPAMRTVRAHGAVEAAAPMSFAMSFLPYILLTGLTIGALVIEPLNAVLGRFSVGLPFPEATTGYGVVRAAAEPYSPIAPLTHPGTFLILTSVVTWMIYRARGYYAAQALPEGGEAGERSVMRALLADAIPASVPVIAFLAMAQIMNHSGQNDVLALGIAAVAPAMAFAFLSGSIGALGAFMTSSSTSSNVLFSDLQHSVAELKSLPEAGIIAAQSAGGAIGNAIAPANVVLGASTAGIAGQEGAIIRKTLPWTIIAVVLTGAATVLLVWVFP
ncbi:L-lactate permease [Sinisalibacter aestuarii]|uniref:L-lactate permease n=1 Tax=Sinisalibacter aestuarii TaxID=2949426 RepID=A0ABQ5LPH2_9RHOB|nr:L-lactate permease [Sinisalibacter aestuarii]GKY86858.1 lactate permease [Sinisalibacter aestuarii]